MTAPSTPAPLRLLIVDDSQVVRSGLRALLGLEPTLQVVAEAATAGAALAEYRRSRPDVVLLDIRLPDDSGVELCRRLLAENPEARILMLTSVMDRETIDDALRAGAGGYLLKEIDGHALVRAIREVAAGRSVIDPVVTERVIQLVRERAAGALTGLAALTSQEERILALIAEGGTNREVAAQLGLSEKTVRNHLGVIFEKLHVSRRAEAAARYAQRARA